VTAGTRLAVIMCMLGACRLASGAATNIAAPDAIATRVQTLLQHHYSEHDKCVVVDRVFNLEKRLGAYRAARTQAELIYRLNADLWVATKDRRVSVHDRAEPAVAGVDRYELGQGLALHVPKADSRH
jgi:hypothetical protein